MSTPHAISTKHLVHVLQSIALRQQTGRLSVEQVGAQGGEKGEIFFVHGSTIAARTEHESGETALHRMINWNTVSYTFFEDGDEQATKTNTDRLRAVQRPKNIRPLLPIEMEKTRQTPIMSIAAGSATAIDMAETRQTPAIGMPVIPKSIRPQVTECVQTIGPLSACTVFQALPIATTPRVLNQMERRERVVFLLLNGKRTLRDVARLIHRSELDVARILVHLLKQNYIEYKA